MSEFIKFTPELLNGQNISILREIGRQLGVKSSSSKPKEELILSILQIQEGSLEPVAPSKRGAPAKNVDVSAFYLRDSGSEEPSDEVLYIPNIVKDVLIFRDDNVIESEGVVRLVYPEQYGFILFDMSKRTDKDVFITKQNVCANNLKDGDLVKCTSKLGQNGCLYLDKIISVNGSDKLPDKDRVSINDLPAVYPDKKIPLYDGDYKNKGVRIVDLFTPIGYGQRVAIIGERFTGKKTLVKDIALSIKNNVQDAIIFTILLGESPELISDFKKELGDVLVATSFNQDHEDHIKAFTTVCSRVKRLAEAGENVVLAVGSLSNLFVNSINSDNAIKENEKVVSLIKKAFISAKNIENGGSLTVIVGIDKKDFIKYESEFAPLINCDIILSKELASKRVFPAIDLVSSFTERDNVLSQKNDYVSANSVRKAIVDGKIDLGDAILEY